MELCYENEADHRKKELGHKDEFGVLFIEIGANDASYEDWPRPKDSQQYWFLAQVDLAKIVYEPSHDEGVDGFNEAVGQDIERNPRKQPYCKHSYFEFLILVHLI